MPATRIILIRHGETVWNAEGRYQGHLDSALTQLGEAQARALSERVARRRFAALYSSDLGRALQTAQIVASSNARAIRTDVRLRERHLGDFQGRLKTEVLKEMPEHYRQFKSGDPDHVIPSGESFRQCARCAVGCLTELAGRHPGEDIVVVTHGGVVNAMLRQTLGIALEAPRRFARRNASWNEFVWEGQRWMLETWGDVSHLAEIAKDDL